MANMPVISPQLQLQWQPQIVEAWLAQMGITEMSSKCTTSQVNFRFQNFLQETLHPWRTGLYKFLALSLLHKEAEAVLGSQAGHSALK